MNRFPFDAMNRSRMGTFVLVASLGFALGGLRPAQAIVHEGSSDPAAEGWTLGGTHASAVVGAIPADPAYPLVAAWSIEDPSTTAGSAHFYLAPPQDIPGAGLPWVLRARLRLTDASDAIGMGSFFEVTSYGLLRYLLTFGTNASGETLLYVSSSGETAPGAGTTYVLDKIVPARSSTEYVDLELSFDNGAADLFVNGSQLVGGLPGFPAGAVPPRIAWGAGSSNETGHAHYAEVRFSMGEPPECSNGVDDDGDGATDWAGGDADCASALDPRERSPIVPCDDGADYDSDGMCDVDESRLGLNANDADSDGDGLGDGDEIGVHATDPAEADSDGDGFDDGVEVAAGRDPNDAASGPPPIPEWDYAMPSRFAPRDHTLPSGAHNESIYLAPGAELFPSSWTLQLDACATGGLVFEYQWYVDDVLVGTSPFCDGFEHQVPDEGLVSVRLVAIGTGGEEVASERTIEVIDHLIFGLGDSYGSGEGAPDVAISEADVSDYDDSLDALADAQAAAQVAYASWQSELALFNDLVARVNLAFARLDTWQQKVATRNELCTTFPFTGCAAAQAEATIAAGDLVWALGNIGLPDYDVANLPSYGEIQAAIQSVYDSAYLTYQAVLAAWNAANAVVQDTQDLVASLKAKLVAHWQEENCHRSANSGQVVAAQRIEQSDPHSSVTFVHLACSGAKIHTGARALIGEDVQPGHATDPAYQVGAMRAILDGRTADAVFVSIGGNDARFASAIEACVLTEPCFQPGAAVDAVAGAVLDGLCDTAGWFLDDCQIPFEIPEAGENAESLFLEGAASLAGRYQRLAGWLNGDLPTGTPGPSAPLVAADHVFLTEYPDFIGGDDTNVCGWDPTAPGDPTKITGLTTVEALWARYQVVPVLAGEMSSAADLNGWQWVSGVSAPYATHGYCASDPWVVRFAESFATQGDISGSVHPTSAGQLSYADALETAYMPEPSVGWGLGAGLLMLVNLSRRRTRRGGDFD